MVTTTARLIPWRRGQGKSREALKMNHQREQKVQSRHTWPDGAAQVIRLSVQPLEGGTHTKVPMVAVPDVPKLIPVIHGARE